MSGQANHANEARCPSCGAAVDADPSRCARRGFMRLKCEACGNRFVMQVNRRELRLATDLESGQDTNSN